jgi:UV DNA damage repair endonuclease
MTKRIGFACKWIDHADQVNGLKPKDAARKYNTGTTTITWLNRQPRAVAEEKLWNLMKQNTESTLALVARVGEQHDQLRMVRLSSDILPAYTEPSWKYFWQLPDVQAFAERQFSEIGSLARDRNVRLSFHPGQFCVLASSDADIVARSIEEFEYHADMARWMGYGQKFQDFKINVHISGRQGPAGIRAAYGKLSPEARNCLTIENEEISYGLDDCLSISDLVPIVLDIHHNWIREGQYIEATSDSVKRVVDSWRGVRPVLHYSVSREDCLDGHDLNKLPERNLLLEQGHNKQKLRAHSDFYWNQAVNEWALTHWSWADIMCESKAKNLASFALHDYARQLNLV